MIAGAAALLVELAALLFGVAFAIELVQRRVGTERLRRWMSGHPATSALKGIAVGFLTPFCTYSAIPMLVALRRAGVPTAGFVAFIVAAPVLDPVLFGALVVIVGVDVAIVYLAVAFVGAMVLALVAQYMGIDRYLKPLPAPSPIPEPVVTAGGPVAPAATVEPPAAMVGCSDAMVGCSDAPLAWRGAWHECRHAAATAFGLLRSVGPLLLVGVVIGLAIEAWASPDLVAAITPKHTTTSIPIAAALGVPLYFHTELFIPIADSLHAAGLGTGAIVALTIAGAGANVPEFVILTRLATRRLIAILFGYVFVIAVVGGTLAQIVTG